MDNFANTTIKGYELRQRVGAGSFGIVYRAYQPSVRREVAIKIIQPQYANQPEFVRRFEVEAQLVARLEHPHIVPLFDYWRDPTGAYLVMRWLPGSLRANIERGLWTPAAAAKLLDQLSAALTVAHRDDVIHRDIKPDNILLDEDGNGYLADFSIAKDLSLRGDPDGMIGTPAYLSPEQIRNEPLTPRTDIYSLGYVLYELLTGERAFPDATTPIDYMNRHLTTTLPLLSERNVQVPAAVDEVLQTATAKDPTRRYGSAQRFAAAFRAALPVTAPRAPQQPLADPLTERELEVLRLMVDGYTNEAISESLFLSSATVKWYVKQIYSKLDAHSRHQAIERAQRLQLVELAAISMPPAIPDADLPARGKSESAVPEPANPYKGLRAFQEADSADFFGRASLVEQFLNRLSEGNDGTRFLAVVGPSGSGKSSAVNAGLIPALRSGALPDAPQPFIAEMLPGTHPLEELEAALLRVAVSPLPSLLDQLREDRRGLVRAAKRILPPDSKTELFLIIDQFEEVFTLVEDEATRVHFIDNLLSAASDPRGRVRIILTLRADFYDRPLLYPRLAEFVRSHTEIVLPLNARDMEQAIVAPVERVGVRLETGLLSTIISDVGEQPGALPLLQYALTELFERREGLTLTLDGYRATGGVLGALAHRAEDIYAGLAVQEQALARQVFLRLVTLGEGAEDTRRRTLLAELTALDGDGGAEDVINVFAQYRLLTLDCDPLTHTPTVEIAHEALIREWSRLREWLAASREDVRIQRSLAHSAAEWNAAGDVSFLASGGRLAQFEAWAAETDLALTFVERAYLDASTAERKRRDHAEAEQTARERALERRSRRFLRMLVVALLAATLGAFALTGIAVHQSDVAQQALVASDANFQRSEALRLASAANTLLPGYITNYQTAALLAIRSLSLQYSAQADNALSQAIRAFHTVRYFPATNGIFSRAFFSPDHRLLAVDTPAFDIQIWDAQNWRVIHTLSGHTEPILDIAWAPNSRLIVSASRDGASRIWDVETGTEVGRFPGTYYRAHFSPDSRLIGTVTIPDWKPLLWDVSTDTAIEIPHIDDLALVHDVDFSPDGSMLFVNDFEIDRVIDIESGALLREIPCALFTLFSEDGKQLMCVNYFDRTVDFWDTTTWEVTQTAARPGDMIALAFSPDGKQGIVGTGDGHIMIVDTTTGQTISEWVAAGADVYNGAFLPNGYQFIAGSDDGTARIWDIRTGTELRRFTGFVNAWVRGISADGKQALINSYRGARLVDIDVEHEARMFSGIEIWRVSFSPDGTHVLIGDAGSAFVWDVATESVTRRLSIAGEESSGIANAVYSPDGRLILTGGSRDSDVRLWDADTGELIRIFPGPSAAWEIDFSPTGMYAAGSSDVGDVFLWNTMTGETERVLPGHSDATLIRFSPDGRFLASADSAGVIRIWDIPSGERIKQKDSGHAVNALAWSPDSQYLVVAGGQTFSEIWDADSLSPSPTFPSLSGVVSAIFSSDGKQLYFGHWDGAIRVLEAETGTELRYFKPHSSLVTGLALSPDGSYLVSGSLDGSAYMSDVEVAGLIDYACSKLLWDFTPEEREQYEIPDDDPTCPET